MAMDFYLSIVDLETAILILFVPLVFELPRVVIKCLILLYDRFSQREEAVTRWKPKVSIVVPAHNEGEVIEDAIESLLDIDYPNKEIIVIDDGSTDDTYLKARWYAQRGLIKLFRKEGGGSKASALNYGFAFASGDIIVFLDADTRIQRETLEEIISPFTKPEIVAVAGNVRVLNDGNLLGKMQAYEYLVAMEMGRQFQSILNLLLVIPGAFGAFRRRLLHEVGVMDEDTITEDFDMVFKMKKTGGTLFFNRNAVAWTVVPSSWKEWFRQRIRWARGELQTLRKHSDVILKMSLGVKDFLSTLDMIITDIVLLYLRTIWFVFLPFIFREIPLWDLMRLIATFYLILEAMQAVTAVIVSPRGRREVKYLPLIPIITFFYRPIYALVRFVAYTEEMIGLRAEW